MMCVLKLIRSHRRILTLLGIVFLSLQASAESPQVTLSCHLPSTSYLLGEPIELLVRLQWEKPQPATALITSKGFLVIEMLKEDGTALVTPDDWKEILLNLDGDCRWCDQILVLTSEESAWQSRIRLNSRFRLDDPGTYTVVVRWETPPSKDDNQTKLQARIEKYAPPKCTHTLLEEYSAAVETKVILSCPERETDRRAFELLAGESCPTTHAVVFERERIRELLRRYPSSRYAGYVLAKRPSVLPGVGADPYDKVRQLSDPAFFTRFPQTYDRDNPPPAGKPIDMKEEVQRQAQMRRLFLKANPDFPLRAVIEEDLGNLELTLGNYEDAYAAWQWIGEQQKEGRKKEWAQGMVTAMETLGLIKRH